MTPATAIGFDLGDTLCEYAGVPLSWLDEYPAALAAVARRSAIELTAARLDAGIRLLSRYNTRVTPRVHHEEYSAEHIFDELLRDWGASRAGVALAVDAFFAHFSQRLRAFPEAAGVLRQLHERGVPVGVLTDVPYGMPRALVSSELASAALELRDPHLVTSAMVGRRKPHTAGFRALARALGVPCARLLYVGNEQKDIEGANAAGCQAVLVWRTNAVIPAWGQARTVRSLEQLFELLG